MFDEWMRERDSLPRGSEEAFEALENMAMLAKTFQDWRNVFFRAPAKSKLERIAAEGIAGRAETFGQHLLVYEHVSDPVCRDSALRQLEWLADTLEDVNWMKKEKHPGALRLLRWQKIFYICPNGRSRLRAFRRIGELLRKERAKERKEIGYNSSDKI